MRPIWKSKVKGVTESGVSALQAGVGLAEATGEHGHSTDPASAPHGHAEPGRRQGLKGGGKFQSQGAGRTLQAGRRWPAWQGCGLIYVLH